MGILKRGLILAVLCAAVGALAFGEDPCLDNCGQFSASCLSCHYMMGPANKSPEPTDGPLGCQVCNQAQSATLREPVMPFATRVQKGLVLMVTSLFTLPKRSEVVSRGMTPARHVELMMAALTKHVDELRYPCGRAAFTPGTAARLPVEIRLTRDRIAARART